MALETGNANYVLIWVPEESVNTVKNLLERTYCERSVQKNKMQNRAIKWYFETVNRLYYSGRWPHYTGMKFENIDEKLIALKVERAIEAGNIEEIISILPITYIENVKQRYYNLMNKRNFDVNNIAAGRDYVAAFIELISYIHSIPPIN
jgi:hypothetical protein